MKIYISGKITGDKNYKYKFKVIEEYLIRAGYTVMNPAILPLGFEHEEYMKICVAMLEVCDAIYMLTDWEDSKGAKEEYEIAKSLGKEILFELKTKAENRVLQECEIVKRKLEV